MSFPYTFETIIIALIALFFLIQIYYYWFYFGRLLFFNPQKQDYCTETPPVSIVICAKNEEHNLKAFLPDILNQSYPNFQVVVVNDCSSDETEDYLLQISSNYPNLYHTTIKPDPIFEHGKKLALTIGIKAAKHELLLLTDADCKPTSNQWLATMVRNFTPKTEIILGYGAYEKSKGLLNNIIAYDTFFAAVQYLSFALAHKAYMGVGRNLAYRKALFFSHKGFASHSFLKSGDDDLFVNKAAQKTNVRVEISPEAQTISVAETSFRKWLRKKRRHLTTGKYYKKGDKFRLSLEVISRELFYISLISALFFPIARWVALGTFIFRLVNQLVILNVISKKINERRFFTGVLFYDMFMPIIYLWLYIRNIFQPKIKWK